MHEPRQGRMPTSGPLVVIVGEDIGPDHMRRLQADFPAVDFRLCLDNASFAAAAPDAHIIFSKRFPGDAMAETGELRWVQAGTAGVNHLLEMGLAERKVLLTNATGAHGVPMAELIISMMLAFVCGLHTLIRAQSTRQRVREQVLETKSELAGQTVCVLGLGDIGGTLAYKCQQLGMRVLGVRRSEQPFAAADQLYPVAELPAALSLSDHVALCLPLTEATTGIIGEAELRAMKSTAYIYNVGRGASIDAQALLQALQEGWIAGAGLDVTDPEPLPADSPLWDMPNVILSQHTSGSSPYNAGRITEIFRSNLRRYLDGQPLRNVIDPARGY